MDMLELKRRAENESSSHSILIYGDSGTGKTRMAATAALIPEIKKIVCIDLENGSDTILHMGLPDEALEKIQLFKLLDTRKEPHAMGTLLKMFSSKCFLLKQILTSVRNTAERIVWNVPKEKNRVRYSILLR